MEVLQTVGFKDKLINVIMSCMESSTLSVLWNGVRLKSFQPERGLRQGDPLSPYLFVLCMEVLGQRIKRAVDMGSWKACRLGKEGPAVSHLFFVDDLILFGEASVKQTRVMQEILSKFCGESGQKVNMAKSQAWFSPNTTLGVIRIISTTFGIKFTGDLGKYLGTPLIHGRLQSKPLGIC